MYKASSLWRLLFVAAAALVWLGGGLGVMAHPATLAAATAKVQPDGYFEVQARFDILAFVLDDSPIRIGDGPMNALLDGPVPTLQSQLSDAEARFRRDFQVAGGNGPGTLDSITFPTVADVQAWCNSGVKPRLPVMIPVIVQGHLPPGAQTVSFRFPNVLGMIVVTTEFPYREPTSEPLEAGEFSTPLPLVAALTLPGAPSPPVSPPDSHVPQLPAPAPAPPTENQDSKMASLIPRPLSSTKPTPAVRETAVVRDSDLPLPFLSPLASPPVMTLPAAAPSKAAASAKMPPPVAVAKRVPQSPPQERQAVPAAPPTVTAAANTTRPLPWIVALLRYVQMGFHHIMPEGIDHILFVLGLFLLSTKLKPLLWQITAFTVAHSLTLALSLYGVLRLPPAIVEPIIAASIAFVAIENLFTTELKPWRPFVVFGFGLVHGMGFAGALLDLGLPRHDYLTALVGFNLGVELGQLSVVALGFLAVGWLRSRPNYRRLVVIPASVAIAAVAIFWTFQRIFNVV